jgi:hypothetical protein
MQSKFFLNRIFKYLDERFNLLQFISLSLILAGFIGVSTQLYLFNKISLLPIFLSTVALFLFLFRLRIFDEFKDYSHDIKHYPNRPISNGLVTLKELRLIFFPAIFLEIILALYLGKIIFIFFSISLLYSLLMFKEFFITDWLRKHFSTYIFSHEILVIPLFFYLCSINGLKSYAENPLFFLNLVICTGSFMFLLEIARKVRPKELEVASKDTYTAQYGILGASLLLLTVSILSKFTLVFNFYLLKGSFFVITIISLSSLAYLLIDIYRFYKSKSHHTAKRVFKASIIFSVVNLVASVVLSII